MSKYEIKQDELSGDWDLYRDNKLIAWWRSWDQCIAFNLDDEEIRARFKHLDYMPATEAHGLLILNAIKQQLENDNEHRINHQ